MRKSKTDQTVKGIYVDAIFESSFSFYYISFVTSFALNHVNKVFRVSGNVESKRSCFACGMECVRTKPVGYVGALRTMASALKRASGFMLLYVALCLCRFML